MSKFNSLLKLIRFRNLLIIILTQVLIKYWFIEIYLNNSSLSNTNFTIYLFALISIVASGYIINDIYDVEIDNINKPKRKIIDLCNFMLFIDFGFIII